MRGRLRFHSRQVNLQIALKERPSTAITKPRKGVIMISPLQGLTETVEILSHRAIPYAIDLEGFNLIYSFVQLFYLFNQFVKRQ